jgi:hypothetical protein
MLRKNSEEILDSDQCPAAETATSLRDLCRINRWFGGVATTRMLIQRVVSATGLKRFSLLEVAAGFGEVPRAAAMQLARQGVSLDITTGFRLTCSGNIGLWSPTPLLFPFAMHTSIS